MEINRIENSSFKKLIGTWKTEGLILKTETNSEMKISGTDSYEFILDGFFILHKADVLMGNERSQTHEIIGLDKTNGEAIFQYYDNEGSSGKMFGNLVDNKLKINGDGLRFKGQFSNNNNEIMGTWEKFTKQNKWVEFLKMNFTKIA